MWGHHFLLYSSLTNSVNTFHAKPQCGRIVLLNLILIRLLAMNLERLNILNSFHHAFYSGKPSNLDSRFNLSIFTFD